MSNLLFALLGFLAGVLVNRAADNLPPPARLAMLETPRCVYCGKPRRLVEQIGLAGFLLAQGRCSNCQSPLSLRRPTVELGTVILFTFVGNQFGLSAYASGLALMTAILILITVVDMEHRLILNVVVLPGTLLALLLSPFILRLSLRASFVSAVVGMIVGYVSLLGIYLLGKLFVRLMARAQQRSLDEVAFGLGDVKLAGFVGALVGFPAVIYALVYAILLGGVVSFFVLLFQVLVRKRYSALMAIPYGPFITITAWLVMILGIGFNKAFPG